MVKNFLIMLENSATDAIKTSSRGSLKKQQKQLVI